MENASKIKGKFVAAINKKSPKNELQLVFEFVNKVILPRSQKRNVASAVDLYMMECFRSFEFISLPALMIEKIHKVVYEKMENMACLVDTG